MDEIRPVERAARRIGSLFEAIAEYDDLLDGLGEGATSNAAAARYEAKLVVRNPDFAHLLAAHKAAGKKGWNGLQDLAVARIIRDELGPSVSS